MVALVRQPVDGRSEVEEANDRRIFSRRKIRASAECRRLDHSLPALRQPRLTLDVRDVSLNGVSALCDVPLMRGEHLGIRFSPETGLPGWGTVGRVVRCEPSGLGGYRVALEFDPLPAA